MKEYAKAIADFNETIRLDPQDAIARQMRGFTWSHLKQYDKAIRDFSDSIELNPRMGFTYSGRGLAGARGRNMRRRSPISTKPSG